MAVGFAFVMNGLNETSEGESHFSLDAMSLHFHGFFNYFVVKLSFTPHFIQILPLHQTPVEIKR